jgi:AP2-associated kinase
MLREHGTQRPSIFETLEVVHRIRGTKSRFSYSIPEKQPLSPRTVTSSSNFSALDDLVTFNSQPTFATKNAGTQARDKVLEAIAPMRRGRPNRDLSPSPSPNKDKSQDSWMNGHFSTDIGVNDQEWKTPPRDNVNRGHKLGVASSDAWKVNNPVFLNDGLGTRSDIKSNLGFDNDFSGKGYPPFLSAPGAPKSISNPVQIPAHSSQTPTSPALSSDLSRLGAPRSLKSKDAFDGLGLSEKRPAPTLGEVRKARTGLALPDYSFYPRRLSPQLQPAPSPLPSSHPLISTSQNMLQNLTIEERFPSVE